MDKMGFCAQKNIINLPYLTGSCFPFQEHHEEDFFLYIAYSDESVYGVDVRDM